MLLFLSHVIMWVCTELLGHLSTISILTLYTYIIVSMIMIMIILHMYIIVLQNVYIYIYIYIQEKYLTMNPASFLMRKLRVFSKSRDADAIETLNETFHNFVRERFKVEDKDVDYTPQKPPRKRVRPKRASWRTNLDSRFEPHQRPRPY